MGTDKEAVLAVERYLELTGRNIIHVNLDEGIIFAEDDEGIAIIDVRCNTNQSFDVKPWKSSKFEDVMHKFFHEEYGITDVAVRYDLIVLSVISDGRALIKHYVNAIDRLEE